MSDWVWDGGRSSLDLLNTVRARGNRAPLDTLTSPSELACWLREAGLLGEADDPEDGDLNAARRLRAAIDALAFPLGPPDSSASLGPSGLSGPSDPSDPSGPLGPAGSSGPLGSSGPSGASGSSSASCGPPGSSGPSGSSRPSGSRGRTRSGPAAKVPPFTAPAAVAVINAMAAHAPGDPRLALDGEGRPVAVPPRPSVTAALGRIALDAIELLGGDGLLRVCAAEDCGIRFVDRSPSGNRQWCSMRRCGNRLKARRHYARTSL